MARLTAVQHILNDGDFKQFATNFSICVKSTAVNYGKSVKSVSSQL